MQTMGSALENQAYPELIALPLRIEYAGALYNVTSRGDRWENIYLDDEDRETWLEAMALSRLVLNG